MDEAYAKAEECRRLASEFTAKALTVKDAHQQQAANELARHFFELARSWLAVAESRSSKKPQR